MNMREVREVTAWEARAGRITLYAGTGRSAGQYAYRRGAEGGTGRLYRLGPFPTDGDAVEAVETALRGVRRAEVDADGTCVGFSDCPCRGCRRRRFDANDAHNKGRPHDGAYCEPCTRARREAAQ